MEPLNDEEKRLILAEMIKTSQTDIKTLERFIKSHRIKPNWLQMQLPAGRDLAQCMQAADDMDLHQRGKKRKIMVKKPDSQSSIEPKSSSSQELPPLSQASAQGPDPGVAATSTATDSSNYKHVPILPRLSTTVPINPALQRNQQAGLPKKKKKKPGRPAYAGRAKTSLRPFNPRPIAPRPPVKSEHSESSQTLHTVVPAPAPTSSPVTHSPALGPAQQLAVGGVAAPFNPFGPDQGPTATMRRRDARRRDLGLENGLSAPLFNRSTKRSPSRSRSIGGIKREPLENYASTFSAYSTGNKRGALLEATAAAQPGSMSSTWEDNSRNEP
ncbi:hypothetical protein FZEAL_6126 [Fusarium zealandicum]|uniref:Uncharacterized protein n=1 Tax=Fusarium zealandicum TaxID=1053134 RepID=A0A8H4UJ80_9HYPO|nr:hypothetical protein FZEAL_6126 [Fusarium zealandicum]